MILTVSKKWSEIREACKQWQLHTVAVISCGSCSAQCGTGGTEGLKKIVASLEQDGIKVAASIVIEEPCDRRLVKNDLRHIKDQTQDIDGYLVASCGMGAQTVREITNKPVIITADTIMMSQTERIGMYHEKCRACGQCLLNETGGICPITTCAKSLLNGPCGGVIDGKCEVGGYQNDCGWVAIYNRLKDMGQLELFSKVRPPRDWSLVTKRSTVNTRKEMKNYYACEK